MSSADLTSDCKANGDSFVTETICRTTFDDKKCSFKWTINRFVEHKIRGGILKSPHFSAAGDAFMWEMRLAFPGFYDRDLSIKTDLYVYQNTDLGKYAPISGQVKFSIIRKDNSEGAIIRNNLLIRDRSHYCRAEPIKTTDLQEGWLSDGKLTIFCEVTYIKNSDIIHITSSACSKECETPELKLSRDLEMLFVDKEFSDVTVSLKSKQYPAHKNILAARSPVFKALLKNNMKEKASNLVEISDISCKVFEEMLRYIYTGKVNNLEESAFDLLIAADKYDMKELRILCERTLFKTLSVDNALDILILAEMHHADLLKRRTLQFIKTQSSGIDIMNTNAWTVLCTSHPNLMKDIVAVFFKH